MIVQPTQISRLVQSIVVARDNPPKTALLEWLSNAICVPVSSICSLYD